MTRAWDDLRPPEQRIVDDCVRCGFCLPTCPTYLLWGEEMDSPRGRIRLIGHGLQEGSELSNATVEHLDRCLGCMACVSACPSQVRFDELIERARPQIERQHRRSLRQRLLRGALLATFTHPARLRPLVPLIAGVRRLGAPDLAARLPSIPGLATPRALLRLTPSVRTSAAWRWLPSFTPARGERRGRIGLLQGCVQRVLFHDVNAAAAATLASEGFDVIAPRAPSCCGALQLHAGLEQAARARAQQTIAALEGCDRVVVTAAGCGSALKRYGELLADDPAWARRATAFGSGVRDVTEVLAEIEPRAPRHPLGLRVAYHDACHLAHGQGVRAQPRALLASIPALELLEGAEEAICCGSAGLYNLLEPEPAAELGRRKAANLLATGADLIAAANPGCALQIAAHLREGGRSLPVVHPVELLWRSISAA